MKSSTTLNEIEYHIDHKLLHHWKKNGLSTMKNKNSDKVYIVDGRERCGKSTWAIQQMGLIDPKAFSSPEEFVSRICFTAEQFNSTVRNTRNGVIIFDEAFRGMSSRTALSKVNKEIIETLMEMGQNNNIVFIVLPSIFRLDMYAAVERSDGLFHISEDKKTNLRKWEGYNRIAKNQIFQIGVRKGWKYNAKTRFNGRFGKVFPAGDEFQRVYDKKKRESFMKIDKKPIIEKVSAVEAKLNKVIYEYKEKTGQTFEQMRDIFQFSAQAIHKRYHKHRNVVENKENQLLNRPKDSNINALENDEVAPSP